MTRNVGLALVCALCTLELGCSSTLELVDGNITPDPASENESEDLRSESPRDSVAVRIAPPI